MNTSNNASNRVLDKIKKCLALSQSANPHEAETALRQARKLMQKHELNLDAVAASAVNVKRLAVGMAATRPATWRVLLGNLCAQAFECELIIKYGQAQVFIFVGMSNRAEFAAYAYKILERQLVKARRDFTKTLIRCRLATRRRRGDAFAKAWIAAVKDLVADFAEQDIATKEIIEQYQQQHFPELAQEKLSTKKVYARDAMAVTAGWAAGRKARIFKPLHADKTTGVLSKEVAL